MVQTSSNKAGLTGGPDFDYVKKVVESEKYQLLFHMHNHTSAGPITNSNKWRSPNIVPSPQDVCHYQKNNIPLAIVTDGVFSVRINLDDIRGLKRHSGCGRVK